MATLKNNVSKQDSTFHARAQKSEEDKVICFKCIWSRQERKKRTDKCWKKWLLMKEHLTLCRVIPQSKRKEGKNQENWTWHQFAKVGHRSQMALNFLFEGYVNFILRQSQYQMVNQVGLAKKNAH